jgi:predicted Kef-type K+ transport protein
MSTFRNPLFHLKAGVAGLRPRFSANIPMVFEEETSPVSMSMIFTALAAVVMYAMEPGLSVVLFLFTYGIAVYTTGRPDVKAWELYQKAVHMPVNERIELLQRAREVAPKNSQVIFALALSLKETGAHLKALETLRVLDQQHPGHAAVEVTIASINRFLLAQASTRPQNA